MADDNETRAWQVFKLEDSPDPTPAIDDRDPRSLVYVGLIVKPADGRSYWTPDEENVGQRFGAGMFFLIDDDAICDWTLTKVPYERREPIFLDVVAETRYQARAVTL